MKRMILFAAFGGLLLLCLTAAWIDNMPKRHAEIVNETPEAVMSALPPTVIPRLAEQAVIDETNIYRKSKNLTELATNGFLMESARTKANDLCQSDNWSHTDSKGREFFYFIREAGYEHSHTGENLARGYTDESAMLDDFLVSPTHKDNVEGAFNEIGVGYSECDGQNYVAIHYGLDEE